MLSLVISYEMWYQGEKAVFIPKLKVFRLSIESMKSIKFDKNRLILVKKVVSVDFYRLTDTIDIDKHDFIDWYRFIDWFSGRYLILSIGQAGQ